MDYIITTEQLTKKYKNFTSVNHVSLHIRKGSIYGFLGPNGAGKSTTMKMLLGLTAPTKGSFTIDGKQFPQYRTGYGVSYGQYTGEHRCDQPQEFLQNCLRGGMLQRAGLHRRIE